MYSTSTSPNATGTNPTYTYTVYGGISEGDIAICTLLMIQISMVVMGSIYRSLVGIKIKKPIYD